jgi:O-antigen ligase
VNAFSGRTRAIVDAVGGLLLLLYMGAAALAGRNGGSARPLALLLLASAAALAAGRALGHVHRALVPAAVVVGAVAVLILVGPAIGGAPFGGPFGYRNATGAFYGLAAVAALMVAASIRWTPIRVLGVLVAIAFGVAAAKDSSTAGIGLLAVAVASIAFAGVRAARASIAVGAALVVLVLAGTIAVGATYQPGDDNAVIRAVTERRVVLWRQSLHLMGRRPGGFGPGTFAQVDRTARQDADVRWAHNEFLQEGVELGWAGFALLVLVFAWAFVRLWVLPAPDIVAALGAASLAALGVHSSIDYVLHFPAIPLIAAALVGTAQAVPSGRFTRDHDASGQESVQGGDDPVGAAGAAAAR